MQTKIVTTIEEFYKLKDDWKRLQEQDTEAAYYSTFEYNWTWWNVYHEDNDKKLFIICIYENKIPICIAPFMIINKQKAFLSWSILKFLSTGDYLNIIINKGYKNVNACIKEVFKTLDSYKSSFDRIQLTHIRSESELAGYILKSDRYNRHFQYLIECPVFYPSKFISFDEYIKTRFKPSEIKYYVKKLQNNIGYQFKVINNKYDYNIFDKIEELHKYEKNYLVNNKKRNERRSLFDDDKRNLFIKKLYSNNENVITFVLQDNEENILIYYSCYLHNNVLFFWNTAYNPQYEKYDLAKVLNYEVFKYIFDNNLSYAFDYGAGRYPWKFRWTNDFIFDYQLDMWNERTKKGKMLKKLYDVNNKFK